MTYQVATYELSRLQLSKLGSYPAAAYDAIAADGKTVVVEKALLKRNEVMPEIPGGWKLQWITKPPRRDSQPDEVVPGRVVLFFNDARTKKLWVAGQRVLAQRVGLTAEQADVWVRSKVPYKHDNLSMLVRVLGSKRETEAYLKWPGSSSMREDIEAWVREYSIKDTMHDKRRDQVSQLVMEVMHAASEAAPRVNSALDEAMAKLEQSNAGLGAIEAAGDVSDSTLDETINGNVGGDAVSGDYAGEEPAEATQQA